MGVKLSRNERLEILHNVSQSFRLDQHHGTIDFKRMLDIAADFVTADHPEEDQTQ